MPVRTIIFLFVVFLIGIFLTYNIPQNGYSADKAGCEAYLYISNNSLYEINLTIDGFGFGHLLVGTNKTYSLELLNDVPKKMKVKVEYQDPDFIEARSFYYISKKLECGQGDSIFVAFTKYYHE
jgi:hypothetical protein